MTKRYASHTEFEQYNKTYDPRVAQVTPGYVGAEPSYRDARDAALAGVGVRNSYPDEALGSVRTTVTSYSRGVHVGERLNAAAYLWPTEFNPQTALDYEAQGLKWTASEQDPVRVVNGAHDIAPTPVEISPERQSILAKLLPNWH